MPPKKRSAGPSAAGAGEPGSPSRGASTLRELALSGAAGGASSVAVAESARRSNRRVLAQVSTMLPKDRPATVAEVEAIVVRALENSTLARQGTLLEVQREVAEVRGALSDLRDVVDVVAADVGIIRGQTAQVLKTLKRVVREGGGWKVLLQFIISIIMWIWFIIKLVWNTLTGSSIGSLLTLILADLAKIGPGSDQNAQVMLRFFAVFVLVAAHAFRTAITCTVTKNGKPWGKFTLIAFDLFTLYRRVVLDNPTDIETITIFRTWFQGLLNDAADYIVEMDISNKVYSFVINSDAYRDVSYLVEQIIAGVTFFFGTILSGIWKAIVRFAASSLCYLTQGWIGCGVQGGDTQLQTIYAEIARGDRIPKILVQFASVAARVSESKEPLTEANVLDLISATLFVMALDNVYAAQLDRIMKSYS